MFGKIRDFVEGIRSGLRHCFHRCHGADNLGVCIATASLLLLLLDRLFHTGLLTFLGFTLFCWAMYRALSHNKAARLAENRRFTQAWNRAKLEARQFFTRRKNGRRYKYFKCPGCNTILRAPRGSGEKTAVCPRCGKVFKIKT